MKKKMYEEVSVICEENWDNLTQEDKDSGFGVACMLAYIEGVKPDLRSLSEYTEAPVEDLEKPFYRMLQCGLFSKSFNARGDFALYCNKGDSKQERMNEWHCAWGHIAGIAGGMIYRNLNDNFYTSRKKDR